MNPLNLIPEGWQDEFGFHSGKPPFTETHLDQPHPFPPIKTAEEQTEPMVHCAYCGKAMPCHEGMIIGNNHFDRLHCYVLWQQQQEERPTRVAKIFRKKLL